MIFSGLKLLLRWVGFGCGDKRQGTCHVNLCDLEQKHLTSAPSPGFLNCEKKKGRWKPVLQCHRMTGNDGDLGSALALGSVLLHQVSHSSWFQASTPNQPSIRSGCGRYPMVLKALNAPFLHSPSLSSLIPPCLPFFPAHRTQA